MLGRRSRVLRALFLASVAALAACSSVNPYLENEKRLTQDVAHIDAGQLSTASRDLESLLATTNGQAGELRVQRFYAAYLLTQAHQLASYGAPFIRDVPRSSTAGIGSASNAGASETAHVVATLLYANLGKELASRAKGGSIREGGVELLPTSLRDLSTQSAESNLDLALLAVYSRLGFEDRVSKTLDASPAFLELEACEKLLNEARAPAASRPWVYWTLFHYAKTREEPKAFKFAVRFLETSGDSAGTIAKGRTTEAIEWIRNGSKLAFRCPSCNQPIVPELRACQNDQTPHLSFYAEPKQQ